MDNITLESFINYCDDMSIVTEKFNLEEATKELKFDTLVSGIIIIGAL